MDIKSRAIRPLHPLARPYFFPRSASFLTLPCSLPLLMLLSPMSSAHPQPDPFALYSQQLHQYTLRLWCDHCRRVAKAQAREEADRISRSSSPLKTPDDSSSESSSSSSSPSGSQSS